jgi:NAD(P)-dependent dehydrogenase (short-subunit alcohol dehydrogenase family)
MINKTDMKLKNKVAIVTAVNSGIGLTPAQELF